MQGPTEGIHTVGEPEFEGGGGTAEDLFDGGADSLLARAGVPMMSRVLSTTGAGMKVSICARASSRDRSMKVTCLPRAATRWSGVVEAGPVSSWVTLAWPGRVRTVAAMSSGSMTGRPMLPKGGVTVRPPTEGAQT
ncbi:hypothetical protein ACFUJ0_08395 [Streptomyces sp. NPDC057242]|uniref:hypothetical protein n=1 Tax=unclassified Streptomyces TaxID=2593676 RepID=UPI003632BFEA